MSNPYEEDAREDLPGYSESDIKFAAGALRRNVEDCHTSCKDAYRIVDVGVAGWEKRLQSMRSC
jgi:hypothetical protein